MTKAEQAGLILGASMAGAAAVSYIRGRRGLAEIGMDAVVHGGLVGVGLNVVVYLSEDVQGAGGTAAAPVLAARTNSGQEACPPMGKLAGQGLNLLASLNPDTLYAAAKLAGVSIGPEGDDLHKVVLPTD
jgi:hypothetical protein